jgi:outer membrane protein
MKHLSLIISGIALAGVAYLLYLHLGENHAGKTKGLTKTASDNLQIPEHGHIAYFEMDSVEQQYAYVKEVRSQLKSKQENIANELNNMKKGYMSRIQQLQNKAATMSQQEGEAAQAEINQMQETLQQKEGRLTQELQDQQFKLMQDISKRIEAFLKEYNTQKGYAYIFSHSAGDFIYYKDSVHNITADLIKGLNEAHNKKDK